MEYQLFPLGDQSVVIELGSELSTKTYQKVQAVASFFEYKKPDWLLDFTPALTTVTLFYDAFFIYKHYGHRKLPYQFVCSFLHTELKNLTVGEAQKKRIIEIPVCYGGELGPDLAYVASYNNLTKSEVIRIHSNGEYTVYMLGFAPGFPYLGGMSEKISTPRKAMPRLSIPARSIGIAGIQTGIYPIETPGGWQIIGQTPIDLFLPHEYPPSLLKAGDHIRFIPISYEQFLTWEVRT